MITLLAVFLFLLTWFFVKKNYDYFFISFFAIICFGLSVSIPFMIGILGTAHTIDEKISMYEQENETLEHNIATSVKAYMDYEQETYDNLSNKDAMNLVTVCPELKSDELVKQQINLYIENNRKIKELKEEKITLSIYRWCLYFGK